VFMSAPELINDNGISAIALTFFTALFGAVATVLVQVIKSKNAAREAAEKADEAQAKAEAARKNTVNVSNGFAGGVDKKLTFLVDEVSRLRDAVDRTEQSVRKHLEYHLEKEGNK